VGTYSLVTAIDAACSLTMYDSFGDGWNGARWKVTSLGWEAGQLSGSTNPNLRFTSGKTFGPVSFLLPPSPPPVPSPPPAPSTGSQGDPHLRFADGGVADFRGRNGTYYALLSAPGVQFAAKSVDTDFILQKGSFLKETDLTPAARSLLVHGTFFAEVAWTVRGTSGELYGIAADANTLAFNVVALGGERLLDSAAFGGVAADKNAPTGKLPSANVKGSWKRWYQDGVRAMYKDRTLYVRASGWEVNATRQPIYNHVGGATRWRFDIGMRKLDGTHLEKEFGASSKTCFPHGLIGQSWDGDAIGVSGQQDEYKKDSLYTVNGRTYEAMTTKAMAEGAIEGSGDEYAVKAPHDTDFEYSRFDMMKDDLCDPRKVIELTGKKFAIDVIGLSNWVAGTNDEDAGAERADEKESVEEPKGEA